MHKLGLKLWSINENYIKEAVRLYEKGIYRYIELTVVPGSYDKFINLWKSLDIPYVIHAPNFLNGGLNFAKRESLDKNFEMVNETLRFADKLEAKTIIFHPGVSGNIKETALQMGKIKDSRVVVENKPHRALGGKLICNGYSPFEIKLVIENAGVGFCFDIGHAINSANSQKIDPWKYLDDFNRLHPKIYHLSDGNFDSIYDEHIHLGKGNCDINRILKLIPLGGFVTVETAKDFKDSLVDFEKDVSFFEDSKVS